MEICGLSKIRRQKRQFIHKQVRSACGSVVLLNLEEMFIWFGSYLKMRKNEMRI